MSDRLEQFRFLVTAARMDGPLEPGEESLLIEFADRLGLSEPDARSLLAEARGDRPAAGVPGPDPDAFLRDLIQVLVAEGRLVEKEQALLARAARACGKTAREADAIVEDAAERAKGVRENPCSPRSVAGSLKTSRILSLMSIAAFLLSMAACFGVERFEAGSTLLATSGVLAVGAVGFAIVEAARFGLRRSRASLILAAIAALLPAGFLAYLGILLSNLKIPHGRPLRRKGRTITAGEEEGGEWAGEAVPEPGALPPEERERLGRRWLDDALSEHASVPAFAQLSLHLAALGAPPELLERTHRAALDEIRHARLCFSLASRYAGRPLAPKPIPLLLAADPEPMTLARLASESLLDGCLIEGANAAEARKALETETDPAVGRALSIIAADEERHAELAWDILEWALKIGDADVRDAVLATAERLPMRGRRGPLAPDEFLSLRAAVLDRLRRLLECAPSRSRQESSA